MSSAELPLNAYARRIVEIIAEAYPSSAQFRGGRKLRKGGWERIFPEIEEEVAAKEDFLRGVEALCSRGILSVKWKRFREGDDVEALYLEAPQALYRIAEVQDPGTLREEMLSFLKAYRPETETARAVRETVLAKLEAYHDIPVSRPEELKDICTLADLSVGEVRGRTIRALSVALFKDSKRIERLLPKADNLTRSAAGEALSESIGLSRKFPEVHFLLQGRILFAGEQWKTAEIPLILPKSSVDLIEGLAFSKGGTVLTVENKETYYTMIDAHPGRFGCIVYTGGYPNEGVKKLLRLLSVGAESFHHFGDLDPEGISIFFDIERSLGRDGGNGGLIPFGMSKEIYAEYRAYGYELNRAALAKLRGITDPRFAALAEAMKTARRGVEQEIIDITGSLVFSGNSSYI